MKKITLLASMLLLLGIGAAQAQITVIKNLPYDSYDYGSLLKVGNVLYGMTYEGGTAGRGNIFSVNTDGSNYKDIWDFQDTGSKAFNYDGEYPYGSSLIMVGNTLFGETYEGGYDGRGNVFSIHTDGTHYRDLWDFTDTGSTSKNWSGEYPYGTLVAIGSKLFGTTYEGGNNGYGTIFRIDTSYALDSTMARKGYKCIWGNFDDAGDSNGGEPYFGALQVSPNGKKLYGTTYEGGKHNYGVVYSIDTNGNHYKDLHDFAYSNSDGGEPYGSVTLSGGMLYGMTYEGGYWEYGTIYSLDTNGTNYNLLYAFTGSSNNGGYPYGDLTITGDTMYGMAEDYGANGYGSIFSIHTDGGGFQLLGSFDEYNTGGYPYGDLTVSNGVAYGVTEEYGDLGGGTVFSLRVSSSLGVNTITDNSGISVYPNPNNGSFTVALSGTTDKSTVEVYNVMGQLVFTHSLVSGNNTMDMNTEANGVYMYRIVSDNDGKLVGQGKLVIQK